MQSVLIRIFLILIIPALFNQFTSPAAAERRIALVVGNSNYDIGRLKNPVNDAADMATALGKLGCSVILRQWKEKFVYEGTIK